MSESINQSNSPVDRVITFEEFYAQVEKPRRIIKNVLDNSGGPLIEDSPEHSEVLESIDVSRAATLLLVIKSAGKIQSCIQAFQSLEHLPDDALIAIATNLLRLRRFDVLQLWFKRIVHDTPSRFVLVFEKVTTEASAIIEGDKATDKKTKDSKKFQSKIANLLEWSIGHFSAEAQDISVEMCGKLYFAYGLFQNKMCNNPKNARWALETALLYWEKRAYAPLALILQREDDFEWADKLVHEWWEKHHSIECLQILMQQDFELGNVTAGLEKWNTITQHGVHVPPRTQLIAHFEFPRDTAIIEAEQLEGDSLYVPMIRGNIMAGLYRATQVTFDKRNQAAEMDYLAALQLGAIELADQEFGKRYIQYLASLVSNGEYGIPFLTEYFRSHISVLALKRYQEAQLSTLIDWDASELSDSDDEESRADTWSKDVISAHARQAIIDAIMDVDLQNPEDVQAVIESHIAAVTEYYCCTPDDEVYAAAIEIAKHLQMQALGRDLTESLNEINEAKEVWESLGEDFMVFSDHLLIQAINENNGWENYRILQRKTFYEKFTPTNELGKATLLSLVITLINQQPHRLLDLEDYLVCIQPETLSEEENTQFGKLLCFHEFYKEGLPYLMKADLEDYTVFSEIILAARSSPALMEEFKRWIKKLQAESSGYPDLIAIAQRHLENTIEADNQAFLPRAYAMVAQVYEIQEFQEEAMKYYMKASNLDDMHGSEAVALYMTKQGQYDRAQEMFAKLYAWSGEDIFLIHLIRNDLTGNRRESAAIYLEELKKINPKAHIGLYLEFALKGIESEKLIALDRISRFDYELIKLLPDEVLVKWAVYVDSLLPQLHPSLDSTADELMYAFMVIEVACKLNDNIDFALQYFEILDGILKNGSKDFAQEVLKRIGDNINMFHDDFGSTFLESEEVIEYTKLCILHNRANVFVDHFKNRKSLYEFAHKVRKILKTHLIQTDTAVDRENEWYALAGECIQKADTLRWIEHLMQSDVEYNPAMLH